MSIKTLQKDIKKGKGYILSDGTLNLLHLLPKVYDLLVFYKIRNKKLINNIANVINYKGGSRASTMQYYGKLNITNDEEANYIYNEDVFNFLNNISPKKYYFGCSEGDGSLIGFFKYTNEF